jgi:hypothetical protein
MVGDATWPQQSRFREARNHLIVQHLTPLYQLYTVLESGNIFPAGQAPTALNLGIRAPGECCGVFNKFHDLIPQLPDPKCFQTAFLV